MSLVDGDGATLDGLLSEVVEVLHAGAACVHCSKPDDGAFAELDKSLMERSALFKDRLRSRH